MQNADSICIRYQRYTWDLMMLHGKLKKKKKRSAMWHDDFTLLEVTCQTISHAKFSTCNMRQRKWASGREPPRGAL